MSKLMLIDAAHPEETRVALTSKGQIEDFDFETAGREQLRGSIYLAKVTRVEPSLQAAFVEYGGNRHGFLAFSEIHPDYYQLPQADREAILREAAEAAADEDFDPDDDDDDDDEEEGRDGVSARAGRDEAGDDDADDRDDEDGDDEDGDDDDDDDEDGDDDDDDDDDEARSGSDPIAAGGESTEETEDAAGDDDAAGDGDTSAGTDKDASGKGGPDGKAGAGRNGGRRRGRGKSKAESAGASPAGRRTKRRPARNSYLKKYKIQEVVRRRQVMLVQVVKEERGNKGAALTTYLSLAGRYSVLMPNTPRGGGISRKISNSTDRRRLKSVMNELDLPPGMGLIVRTAGAKRTKTEIKRDYDYLLKLWDNIREKTLKSIAPCNIHEEGGLVHRAMRDMFEKEIETVWIQGESAYREAKNLAKLIMPSQARKVQQWTDPMPLFVEHDVEPQLDSVFSPTVQLKSGGYLVINQTEALVAIDVNSGRATKARNIEQTALKTNLEAAEEACRQMRLRDLAGLVVIDFIDMDEAKNNRAVENKVKECLKSDRARVQFGRISQFGLMEISRQRRRAGVLQASSETCAACHGTGRRRSVDSAALQLLRAIESRAADGTLKSIRVEAPTDVALYLLNNKREAVLEIETTLGVTIEVVSSASMIPGEFAIDVEKDPDAKGRRRRRPAPKQADTSAELDVIDEDDEDEDDEAGAGTEAEAESAPSGEEEAESGSRRARAEGDDDDDQPKRRRRRGRRGGRRRRRSRETETNEAGEDTPRRQAEPDAVPEDGGAWLDGVSLSAPELLGEAYAPEPAETSGKAGEGQDPGTDRPATPANDTAEATEPAAAETAPVTDDAPGSAGAEPDSPEAAGPGTESVGQDSAAPDTVEAAETPPSPEAEPSPADEAAAGETGDAAPPPAPAAGAPGAGTDEEISADTGAQPAEETGADTGEGAGEETGADTLDNRVPASEVGDRLAPAAEAPETARPKRAGWWNRRRA